MKKATGSLTMNPEATLPNATAEWNAQRIQTVGDSFKTWPNGVRATDPRDAWSKIGRTALPLHGSAGEGKQVCRRHIRTHNPDGYGTR